MVKKGNRRTRSGDCGQGGVNKRTTPEHVEDKKRTREGQEEDKRRTTGGREEDKRSDKKERKREENEDNRRTRSADRLAAVAKKRTTTGRQELEHG